MEISRKSHKKLLSGGHSETDRDSLFTVDLLQIFSITCT